jgi:hypothetical protein
MIVSDSFRAGYLDIPKTGTHAVASVMVEQYGGSHRIGGWHNPIFQQRYKDYCIFATVRNPYSRAVSCWHELVHVHEANSLWRDAIDSGMDDCLSFWRWLYEIEFQAPLIRGRQLLMPQQSFLKMATRYPDCVIHLERFDAEAGERLDFWNGDNLPLILSDNGYASGSKYGNWRDYMSDDLAAIIRSWAWQDFCAFGYSWDWRSDAIDSGSDRNMMMEVRAYVVRPWMPSEWWAY